MSDTETQSEPTIQQLRDRAAKAADLEKSDAAKDRQIAFLKAGIDPDDKRMSYFVNGYDGELTKDAILAEAKESGFITESVETPPADGGDGQAEGEQPKGRTQPTDEQRELEDINDSVRQDTTPPGPPPEGDPMDEGYKAFQSDLKDGRRREDAASQVFGRIIDGAVNGDKRFLVD